MFFTSEGRELFIDQGTALDLDIFATSAASGLTIFALIDRTRSYVGRDHLRRRLAAPADSIEEIALLQQAHRVIAEDLVAYRNGLDRADPDAVNRYVDSRWEIPEGHHWLSRAIGSLWLGIRYPEYIREVENGQTRVIAMLRAADEIRRKLASADNALLREHGAALALLIESPECRELMRIGNHRSGAARLAFDQLARSAAKVRLRALADRLGAFEALWSIGAATAEHGWAYPQIGTRLRITGLFHPFLAVGAVANDFALDATVRVCFLTGPNMAGKSTFLKAVAVASLLAQVGAGVPAESMEFVPVRTLFSSVQIVDNIGAGESFYLAEVRRIRSLATALLKHGSAIAVVDEPFRGTNVHDASEATLAVITRLANQPAAVTLVASHLGEIGPLIANDPRIRSLHFAADVSVDPPRFDYQVREGVSEQRLGMILLNQEKVLELLEQSAAAVVSAV
ncbi:MAG: hypothetical protein KA267_01410 [Gemmatimonadales bacterium]|nr:hypothetical protein [Gemmatimonadales bacterium]